MKPTRFPVLYSNHMQTGTPESQGLPSLAVIDLIEAFAKHTPNMHSLLIARRGVTIAEGYYDPYSAEEPHMLFSLSKSFTSVAVLFAVQEGLVSLESRVIEVLKSRAPENPSENLKKLRVRDLLAMATGHKTEPDIWSLDKDYAEVFFGHPIEFEPGTHFLYNTSATYMLSLVVKQVSGLDLVPFLQPRLFTPLGINGSRWSKSKEGVTVGGFGLRITTREINTFGQFLLQRGEWKGQQLLSADLIDQAASKQVSNGNDLVSEWAQGYGFQFWMCRHGAYRGDGAYGQFLVIHPASQLVVSITSDCGDMQKVLELLWEHLLAELHPEPLPEDPEAHEALTKQLSTLELPVPLARPNTPGKISSEPQTYIFDGKNALEITRMKLWREGNTIHFSIDDTDASHRFTAPLNAWSESQSIVFWSLDFEDRRTGRHSPARIFAIWTGEDRLAVRLAYIQTPFAPTLTLSGFGESLTLEFDGPLYWFDGSKKPPAVGRRGE